MKLLWDAIGTEFAGRHELYELNFLGGHEEIRRQALFQNLFSGKADDLKDFVDQCLAEYDLKGWTGSDLINPNDINILSNQAFPTTQPESLNQMTFDPSELEFGRL